jgi:hypothetical protein
MTLMAVGSGIIAMHRKLPFAVAALGTIAFL